jgi:hypothetical protein
MKPIVPSLEVIEGHIFTVRGHRVMLDTHLAELYGVTTKRLNEQVKRNIGRFPDDFMFQINELELENLRSQIATLKSVGHGQHRKYLPHVFTEHGALMLASVLNSPVAVKASVQVVRAFVKMRETMLAHKELSRRLNDMERKYDKQFRVVFDALRELMEPPPAPSKKQIGFVRERE